MLFIHLVQFFIFSVCIHLFTVFIYVYFYVDFYTSQNISERPTKYDYIIVGSGTAGSLLAHRISTETNYSVVVLEAGGASSNIFEIPILGPLLHGSVYDWLFETVPQDNACLGFKNKKCKLQQGKIVGGSSKLNNMVHVRGNISHYVDWFHGQFDEQHFASHLDFIENNFVCLSELQYSSELAIAILDAAQELEYQSSDKDSNLGFRKSTLSQKNGKRWSTSNNLDLNYVIRNTLVEKVLFDGNTANRVKFKIGITEHIFHATEGIIISAGTYNSPKILQLSGIGPLWALEPLGIPVLKDLPVGENLQDHVTTGLDLVLFNKPLSLSPLELLRPTNVYEYFYKGKGPFTSPGCEAIGFVSTKNETAPDLQFMVLPVGITADRGSNLRKVLGVRDDIWYNYFVKSFDKHAATVLPILLHPKSRGTVFISSQEPKQAPIINPKFFTNEDDLEMLVIGLKLVFNLVNTKAMRQLGAEINSISFPGCEKYLFNSDDYLKCYVRHMTLTTYHPVGTCSMGLPSSKNSVVDTSFKVIGFEKLFVVDGSVLPTLPSGNINAAIAMMANIFYDMNIALKSNGQVCYTNSLHNLYANNDICNKDLLT